YTQTYHHIYSQHLLTSFLTSSTLKHTITYTHNTYSHLFLLVLHSNIPSHILTTLTHIFS
ncbi:hypothetical protein LOTGIDRAFT_123906, partial [Lottia gigantea]